MLTKKVFFTHRLQGITPHCCGSGRCYVPCLSSRRTSKHWGCGSLRSRTSSRLQLPCYRDVPHVFPITEDVQQAFTAKSTLQQLRLRDRAQRCAVPSPCHAHLPFGLGSCLAYCSSQQTLKNATRVVIIRESSFTCKVVEETM